MSSKKRTTIYDIAEKLNIAPSSVSRALSNSPLVKEATKKLIIKTAEELNYKINTIASNLRKGQSNTIGVIVPRINQNFFADVIAGIEEASYRQGYNLIICQSNESYEREVQYVNTLINQQVDCIVVSLSVETTDYKHLESVLDRNIELIQFDRVAENIETLKVLNDNYHASMEAVSHLIEQGYKRIALLEGPQNLNIFCKRKEGYLDALKNHGLPVIEELMLANAWTTELGAEATRKLLSLPEPPDAIFASTSDFAALGVLQVATEMNFKVPEQLGICGYSNENFTEITNPSVTTIDQHSVYMGKTIANLFLEELKNTDTSVAPKTVSIKPKLIIRNSTLKNGK